MACSGASPKLGASSTRQALRAVSCIKPTAVAGTGRAPLAAPAQLWPLNVAAKSHAQCGPLACRPLHKVVTAPSNHQELTRSVKAQAVAASDAAAAITDVHKYRTLTRQGNMMSAVVAHTRVGAKVTLFLSGFELDERVPAPSLHWGMYRASSSQWYHPKDTVPPKSALDTASGGMRTPMKWDAEAGAWVVELQVPGKLLPLHLACVFYYPRRQVYETPARAKYFSIPVGMSAGSPQTLGASIVSSSPTTAAKPEDATCTVNFAVFSRNATAMYLCLVRVQPDPANDAQFKGNGVLEIALDPVTNRTGDVWHICVQGLRNIGMMCYGWRADGDITWESGGRFHPGFLLCDPYASRAVPVVLPELAYTSAPRVLPNFDVHTPVILASLACFTQSFHWGGAHKPVSLSGQQVPLPLEDMVYLELNVDTFTQGPDADRYVARERRGKFLGILDRMREIQECGATAVVLSPSCMCIPGLGPWGRNPLSLFAPDPKYSCSGPLGAAGELKMVVAALHRAGIEVLLSVEYSTTGEGADGMTGGLQGMRGIDAQTYYRNLGDRGSVLMAGHPVVRTLVLDSLKHWATEYCVDGFVFVHAENLAQNREGEVLDNPPLAEEICHDPVLKCLKLIAAPSNASLLPRQGIRGFPHWGLWQQVNDRYQADLRSYLVSNTPGILSSVATRLTGSADLFAPQWDELAALPGALAAGRRAAFGVNSITPLGDQALLASLGADQDIERAEILARTLLLAQFCSSGAPVFSASTFGRKGLWRFASVLAGVRKQLQSLINPPLNFAPPPVDAPVGAFNPRQLKWHAAAPGAEPDWEGTALGAAPSNVIAFTIKDVTSGAAVYLALNPYTSPMQVALPSPGSGVWRVVADTSRLPPDDIDPQGPLLPAGQPLYEIGAKAGILLVAAGSGATSSRAPPPAPRPSSPDPIRPTVPVMPRPNTWSPPMPAGGVPNMPSRY